MLASAFFSKKMKKIIILIWVGLMTQSLCKAQENSSAIKSLNHDTIYFPGLWIGDTLQATYYFQNTSNQKIKVYQVRPGCQCTTPTYTKDSLNPGEKDSLILTFITKNTEEGPFTKFVYFLNSGGEKDFYIIGTLYKTNKDHIRKPRFYKVDNREFKH